MTDTATVVLATEAAMLAHFQEELVKVLEIPLDLTGTKPEIPCNKLGRKTIIEIDDFGERDDDPDPPNFGVIFQPWGNEMNEIQIDFFPNLQGKYIPFGAMYVDEDGVFGMIYDMHKNAWPQIWEKVR